MKAKFVILCISGAILACMQNDHPDIGFSNTATVKNKDTSVLTRPSDSGDSTAYNQIMLHLVHNKPGLKWPVYGEIPSRQAILPYNRIVAYYGNFYTAAMGILGIPEADMLARLKVESTRWQQADTMLPVRPAIHYIAVTAQRNPGPSGKYRLRMPPEQMNKALDIARKNNLLVFFDVQVGWSSLQEELPLLEKYLSNAEAHLGIDPEYSMKNRDVPCSSIGTFDAADVNYAAEFLSGIVRKYNLPPKILVVHRFTRPMLTNYKNIKKVQDVQIVINMDGFGSPAKKKDSYDGFVAAEPVEYTGFKLFYSVDPRSGKRLMEPAEVLSLYPSPVYIQYQ